MVRCETGLLRCETGLLRSKNQATGRMHHAMHLQYRFIKQRDCCRMHRGHIVGDASLLGKNHVLVTVELIITAIIIASLVRSCSTTSRALKREADGELFIHLKDMGALRNETKDCSHKLRVIRHVPYLRAERRGAARSGAERRGAEL